MINLETAKRLASYGNGLYGNAIINGNFDIWQRGTSFSSVGYTSDRWRTSFSTGTVTTSQQTFTIGQTDVPNNPTYYERIAISGQSGTSAYTIIHQNIEDVKTFASQTVTISAWVKASANANISTEFVKNYGSGGSSGESGIIMGDKQAVTTDWNYLTWTVDCTSNIGKTVGSGSSLNLYFWLSAGSTFDSRSDTLGIQNVTFDIAQVQVNAGSEALPFCPRSYGEELSLCERYCVKFTGAGYCGVGVQYTTTDTLPIIPLPTEMRVVPTMTVTGTLQTRDGGSTHTVGATSVSTNSTTRSILVNASAGGTVGRAVLLYIPSSGSIVFDSEI